MASSLLENTTESSQRVHLHPLVLLTASDLITRHKLRGLQGPIVGILLGQQEGTQITAEHAFPAKIKDGLLDTSDDWTDRRIQQYKEVHKRPVLDLVGWFTLCPEDGPLPQHATLHKQLITLYPDNAGIMLAVHPSEFKTIDGTKGKLPVSIYESATDVENLSNDTAMQVDGSEGSSLRFRPVPFVIDTEESEMIAINYVAKGAGSAAAVGNSLSSVKKETLVLNEADTEEPIDQGPSLTTDEEDQLSGMQTRLNSVKMLQQRIQLLQRLVQSTPPSYLSDQTVPFSDTSPSPEHTTHLRNIQALLTKLSLLEPAGQTESNDLKNAFQSQANDVAITSMLSTLGQEVQGLNELGRKFGVVEQSKGGNRNKGKVGMPVGSYVDDFTHTTAGLSDGGLLI